MIETRMTSRSNVETGLVLDETREANASAPSESEKQQKKIFNLPDLFFVCFSSPTYPPWSPSGLVPCMASLFFKLPCI